MELKLSALKKTDKIILCCIFGSIPAVLALFFLYNVIWGPSLKQTLTDMYLSEKVNGVVDSLYDDADNHNIRTALLKNGSLFQIERQWDSEIEVGDTLSKKAGSFLLEVYKKQGKKIVLNYKSIIPSR